VLVGIGDDEVRASRAVAAEIIRGGVMKRLNVSSRAAPNMMMPLPKSSCACAMMPV
jgi:hypothetical protein